jgi:FkbM family methyltransferase
MAEALVSHWFSVTVLDSYDAHRFLTSGMTVLDVGANVGSFTLLASRLVGPTGRIIAVEPVPENWGCLAKFIDENHLGNVETAEIALGDQNGELLLDLGAKSGGHSAVLRRTGRYISVPQRTLDSLVEEFTIRDLGFMKIDVEGYEPEVLRGAEETIRRTRPIIAVSAYHLPEHQELLPSLISGITEDYSVYVRNLAPALELECWGVPNEKRAWLPEKGAPRVRS